MLLPGRRQAVLELLVDRPRALAGEIMPHDRAAVRPGSRRRGM